MVPDVTPTLPSEVWSAILRINKRRAFAERFALIHRVETRIMLNETFYLYGASFPLSCKCWFWCTCDARCRCWFRCKHHRGPQFGWHVDGQTRAFLWRGKCTYIEYRFGYIILQ